MNMYKHQAILKQGADVEKLEDDLRSLSKAKNIQAVLNNSQDEAELKEIIKYAYFYLHYDFIKEALMALYRRSKSEDIRQTLVDLHNGKLDVSAQAEMIEMMKDLKSIQLRAEQAKEEFINEFLGFDNKSLSVESQALKDRKLNSEFS